MKLTRPYTTPGRWRKQALAAEREIARLRQRVSALQTENQLLSYRLAEAEERR